MKERCQSKLYTRTACARRVETYELVCEQEHSLERELAVAKVEEVFERGSEEVQDHGVVVTFRAVPPHKGDAHSSCESFVDASFILELWVLRLDGLELDGNLFAGYDVGAYRESAERTKDKEKALSPPILLRYTSSRSGHHARYREKIEDSRRDDARGDGYGRARALKTDLGRCRRKSQSQSSCRSCTCCQPSGRWHYCQRT